jgi:hypothetical protein
MRLAALLAALCLPHPALAGGGAETEPYDDVPEGRFFIGGLADFYVSGNFNSPASGMNQLRQFDIKANTPSINLVRLTLAHKPRRFGFRLDAVLGDTSEVYFTDDPASLRYPNAARFFSHIGQGFVTVVAPLQHYLAIEVGKFYTPVGLEDNETLPCWNYSRSLIFTFAEPTLHTGVRVTFKPISSLGISLFWVNGWNTNFIDGNDLRSFAVAATWQPSERLQLSFVYMGGLEHPLTVPSDPQLSFRNMIDAFIVYAPLSWLSLAASIDYGNDRARGGVNFWGVAGYLQFHPKPWLFLAARGEYFSDPDGFTTGRRQDVAEGTANLDVQGKSGRLILTGRLEYRHDFSTINFFEHDTRPASRNYQDTLALALTVQL